MTQINPPEDLKIRDVYAPGSSNFDSMMTLLHSDALKAQSIFYCGDHHSIETISTVKYHKNNCITYTRGMFLGISFISFFKML